MGTTRRAIYDRFLANRGQPVTLDDLTPNPFDHVNELRERYEMPIRVITPKTGANAAVYMLPD